MSADLIAFLKAWHDWATNGAPDDSPFLRGTGLCHNAKRWDARRSSDVHGELIRIFGHEQYPFGRAAYNVSVNAGTQHECPKRLAWVRERLVEAGELVS